MSAELSLREGLLHHPYVLAGRPMARFATDARLCPGCAVGVGVQIIVGGELADVAVEAGGIEGEHPVGPIQRLVASVGEVPDAAGRGVVPRLLVDIVGNRQDLEPAALERGEEVVDVLASQDMGERVLPPSGLVPCGVPVRGHVRRCR